MNSREQNAICSALAEALFKKPATIETADWDMLFEEAQAQTVLPLVYSVMRKKLPEEYRQKWEGKYYSCLTKNMRIDAAHEQLHQLLTESSIRYVILKGCASAHYYPDPLLRAMGDVDFFVDPEDLERCSQLLEQTGMQRVAHDSEKHRKYWYHGILYELHRLLPGVPEVGGEQVSSYLEGILETDVVTKGLSGEYCIPDTYYHGMVLLLHTAEHMTSKGVGLRHLCDWAVFIEQMTDEVFFSAFAKPLKEIGLWKFARVLTGMSARFLGASVRSWATDIDEALMDALMDEIWKGGNFGRKDDHRRYFRSIGRDNRTRKIVKRSIVTIVAKEIDHRARKGFPRLAAHVWSLPTAYAAYLFRYLWWVACGKSMLLHPSQDTKWIRKRMELFRELKLFEE